MDYEDPGWRKQVGGALLRASVIGILLRRSRVSSEGTALEAMRSIFLGLVGSVWLILVVLSFVATYRTPDPFVGSASAVVVIGVLTAWTIRALERRLLRARSPQELAGGYQTTFFLQVALAELPALVAFVLSFVASSAWIYVIGATLSSIDFWLMAPSRRNIVRIQERLNAAGVPASLGRILTTRGRAPGS